MKRARKTHVKLIHVDERTGAIERNREGKTENKKKTLTERKSKRNAANDSIPNPSVCL